MKKVAIIGSGIAGLATAARLSSQGYQVNVFEANEYPGGKLTDFQLGAYRFDAGPSLFTLPHLVEDIFKETDSNIQEYFGYKQKTITCNYFYEDGTCLSAWADNAKFAQEVESKLGVPAKSILAYLGKSRRKYDLTKSLFLENSLHKLKTFLSIDTFKGILNMGSLGLFESLNRTNEKAFKDPRLVQLFNRYATYNGSNPYETPGIMSMIPHLEFGLGTYFPKGGMVNISKALYKLAQDKGAQFHFNHKVSSILYDGSQVKGVKVNGETHHTDIVVSNMDVVPTYRKLLSDLKQPEKILTQPRSSSALIFYWGIKKSFPELDLHNILFSADYKTEFEYIFKKKTVYNDPTVYINITSKENKSDAPCGSENWFIMVNVPPNEGQDWEALIPRIKSDIIQKLNRILGINLEDLIEEEQILDPRSIESKTQSYQGALYGASSNNRNAAFLRHANFTSKLKGLYFCGGSVHPGGGIPLCLLSGKIVSEMVAES